MAGIREVEALVAERKVGDLVARHRDARRAVQLWNDGSTTLWRRIRPAASVITTCTISPRQPSSAPRPARRAAARRTATRASPRGRAPSCSITNSSERCDLEPAHECARQHVAGPGGGDRDVREPEDAVRMIVPHVARDARRPARPGRRSPARGTASRVTHADALEPRLHRRVLEHQVGDAVAARRAAARAGRASPPPCPAGRRTPRRPGRTSPRP